MGRLASQGCKSIATIVRFISDPLSAPGQPAKALFAMVSPYQLLVQQRKLCQLCHGLCNPSHSSHAHYDSEEIGPWSRWQATIPAELMIVGQDWGDVSYYVSHEGLNQHTGNPTNENLQKLLASIGLDPGNPAQPNIASLFFTNFVLCLKEAKGLQGKVQESWFNNCGTYFFKDLVKIVSPHAIVALGACASRAILKCYDIPLRSKSFKQLVSASPIYLGNYGPMLFPVYHCGARGVNINRSLKNQLEDWRMIGKWLEQARLTANSKGARVSD